MLVLCKIFQDETKTDQDKFETDQDETKLDEVNKEILLSKSVWSVHGATAARQTTETTLGPMITASGIIRTNFLVKPMGCVEHVGRDCSRGDAKANPCRPCSCLLCFSEKLSYVEKLGCSI